MVIQGADRQKFYISCGQFFPVFSSQHTLTSFASSSAFCLRSQADLRFPKRLTVYIHLLETPMLNRILALGGILGEQGEHR